MPTAHPRILIVFCLLLSIGHTARADSPLTATSLHEAYAGEIAKLVGTGSDVRARTLEALLGDHATDLKAALVSSLGWNTSGQNNAQAFLEALAQRRKVAAAALSFKQLAPEELFVLGYLGAMDDYLELKPLQPGASDLQGAAPAELLTRAAAQVPKDFTIHFILGLVRSQKEMETSFCAVWQQMSQVLKAFPESERNLKPAAVENVMAYIRIYQDSCETRTGKEDPEFDQVYQMVPFRNWMVAGTQAGVVLWDRKTEVATVSLVDRIVSNVMVVDDALFCGSYRGVQRFDGKSWKLLLNRSESKAACKLLHGPDGALIGQQEAKFWRYDRRADTFAEMTSPVRGAAPHDILWRQNGECWTIEFMKGLTVNGEPIALSSPRYPGSDPRNLVEDVKKRLWVIDFERGWFQYDDRQKTFAAVPPVAKGSDLVLDPPSGILYQLAYDGHLTITPPAGPSETIDLSQLQYAWGMAVAPEGDVWVAGWGRTARLSPKDPRKPKYLQAHGRNY
jgi:hypothetical protein